MKMNFKNIIKKVIYKSRILELIYRLFFIFPIKKNRIICSNFEGKSYGESPKYIVEKLREQNSNLDIIWIIDKNAKVPDYINTVKKNTILYFYKLATSKVWIFNSRKKFFFKKRKEQYYVQTWHGCIALKKIEKDAIENLNPIYLMHAKSDSKDIDLFISSNKVFSNQCRTTFEYYGEIIEEGTPKNDILVNQNFSEISKKKVYKNLNLEKDVNILFYAPTFRENYINDPYDIDLEKAIKTLEIKTGKKWIAIVKFHPKLKENEKIKYSSSNIITDNISDFDISELVFSSEIIVTDYSSVMFDGMIAQKKVVLYIKDFEQYYNERGFYIKLEDLPFFKATNNNEVMKAFEEIQDNEYLNNYKKFEDSISLKETRKIFRDNSKEDN